MFAGDANSEQATRDVAPQARGGSSSWRLLAKAVINVSEANTSSARNADLATLWQSSEKYRTQSLVELNQRLLSLTELSIGSRVLEIGAGTGELTELIAQHVGPTGSVVALDPSASMIDVLEQRMRRARLDNVTTIGTTIEAADLPASAFDAMLGRYVLMLIADPVSAMTKIRLSLRDAARVAMAVFSSPDHNPLFSVPPEILRRHAGLDATVEPPANLFALGDPPSSRRYSSPRAINRSPLSRSHPHIDCKVSMRPAECCAGFR